MPTTLNAPSKPNPFCYGWVRDFPDIRDLFYSVENLVDKAKSHPPKVDLSAQCPNVYDQLNLNSCTANAIAGALQFDQMRQKLKVYPPSRLFIYYNERLKEGTTSQNVGAQIRDGIKSVNYWGAPPEEMWPYDTSQFAVHPSAGAYTAASLDRSVEYRRLNATDLLQLKDCLASGLPFVFGFTVYFSIFTSVGGVVPMPTKSDTVDGGHAVLGVGYDDGKQLLKFRNSWGPSWGEQGYGYLPYAYFNSSLVADCWTIQSVTLMALDADPEKAAGVA